MSDTVIKVQNLSKEYRLGVVGHDTLYRDLQSWWAKVRGKEDPNSLLGAHQLTPAGKQTPQSPTATAPLEKGSKASPTAPKARSPLSKAGEGIYNALCRG